MVALLRRCIKTLAYGAGAWLAPVLMRALPGPRLLILTYHRVLPADHPARAYEEQGMVVSPEQLEMQLRLLGRYVTYMHLDDWLALRDSGAALPRLACAVTFDDGWADNHEHAYPLLLRLKVPACIYLATARIGTRRGFWPTRLSRQLFGAWKAGDQAFFDSMALHLPAAVWSGSVAPQRQRLAAHALIDGLKLHYVDEQIDAALDAVLKGESDPADSDVLDWQQVRVMAASGLVKFGSHTRDHRRLVADLSDADMDHEVAGSLQDLRDHLPDWRGGFCYPNGDSSASSLLLVGKYYSHSVLTEFGINSQHVDRQRLRRVGFHDRSGADRTAVLGRIAAAYVSPRRSA